MKAMIFAAGLGTRLKDETASLPKALVEIGGKTLLQRAIEKLNSEGVEEIVVNVHHFADLLIDFIQSRDWDLPIHISDERDHLLDTGGALKKAAHFFSGNSPVLIYNVDVLSNLDLQLLKEEHINSGALATLVVRKRETQRYFKFDRQRNLVGWLNKKTRETKVSRPENFEDADEMAFSGIHIIQPKVLQMMPSEDRFSMVQLYLELAKTHDIKGYFDESDLWIDVGKPVQLAEARRLYG